MADVVPANSSVFASDRAWQGSLGALAGGTFILHLVVSFLVVVPFAAERQAIDYRKSYEPTARSLIAGEGFIVPGRGVAANYPPGYPIWLAGLFTAADAVGIEPMNAVVVGNSLLAACGVVFVSLIGSSLFSRRIGVVAGAIWATYPLHMYVSGRPLSEAVFMPLMFAGLYAIILVARRRQPRLGLLGGLLLGCAALTRSIGIMLPVVGAAALLAFPAPEARKRFIASALVVVGFLLAILPWETYLYGKKGKLIPLSTSSGIALQSGLVFPAYMPEGSVSPELHDFAVVTMDHWRASGRSRSALIEYATDRFKESPSLFFELLWLKVHRAWYGTYTFTHDGYVMAVQLVYLPLLVWGLIAGFRGQRREITLHLLPAGIVLYFYGMAVIFPAYVRFMLPALGVLAVYGAVGADDLFERARRSLVRRTTTGIGESETT